MEEREAVLHAHMDPASWRVRTYFILSFYRGEEFSFPPRLFLQGHANARSASKKCALPHASHAFEYHSGYSSHLSPQISHAYGR